MKIKTALQKGALPDYRKSVKRFRPQWGMAFSRDRNPHFLLRVLSHPATGESPIIHPLFASCHTDQEVFPSLADAVPRMRDERRHPSCAKSSGMTVSAVMWLVSVRGLSQRSNGLADPEAGRGATVANRGITYGGNACGRCPAKDPPKRRRPRICVLRGGNDLSGRTASKGQKKRNQEKYPGLGVARSFGGGVGPPLRGKSE